MKINSTGATRCLTSVNAWFNLSSSAMCQKRLKTFRITSLNPSGGSSSRASHVLRFFDNGIACSGYMSQQNTMPAMSWKSCPRLIVTLIFCVRLSSMYTWRDCSSPIHSDHGDGIA